MNERAAIRAVKRMVVAAGWAKDVKEVRLKRVHQNGMEGVDLFVRGRFKTGFLAGSRSGVLRSVAETAWEELSEKFEDLEIDE
jgi:hypothetical protein